MSDGQARLDAVMLNCKFNVR